MGTAWFISNFSLRPGRGNTAVAWGQGEAPPRGIRLLTTDLGGVTQGVVRFK